MAVFILFVVSIWSSTKKWGNIMVLNTWVFGTCFIIDIPHETFPWIAVNSSINKKHTTLAPAIYFLQIGYANWMEITSSTLNYYMITFDPYINRFVVSHYQPYIRQWMTWLFYNLWINKEKPQNCWDLFLFHYNQIFLIVFPTL